MAAPEGAAVPQIEAKARASVELVTCIENVLSEGTCMFALVDFYSAHGRYLKA